MQGHQASAHPQVCLRQLVAFGDGGRVPIAAFRVHGAVVDALHLGDRGHQVAEFAHTFHALAHCPGNVFREQGRAACGGEELLHRVGTSAADLDVKALELPLEGIQAFQCGAAVVFRAVQAFQYLGEGFAGDVVHSLFQCDRFKSCHR